MTQLRLYLFGPPRLEKDGRAVRIRGRKIWALLGYLAVTGQPQSRDWLAALLWPEHDQPRARANLRRELSNLNKGLDEGMLRITPDQISLLCENGLWLDVAAFQARLAECQTHAHTPQAVCAQCQPLLQEAAGLYTNDFMAGFSLSDSSAFDEWQFFQSESLRQALAGALHRLVEYHRTQFQFEPAITYARRRLSLDPLHEPAHRILMRLYALSDQRALALHQFEECRRILHEGLDVEPDGETQALIESIRLRRYPDLPPHVQQEIGTADLSLQACPSPGSLPAFLDDNETTEPPPAIFVGRDRELAELMAALDTAQTGNGQILFIIGGAGWGKTTLVQEFTRRVQAHHSDLLVISGECNAHAGIGDPYLPFRQALALLMGEVEAKWAGGRITTRHARRLWQAMPVTIPALLEHAAGLVGAFVDTQPLQTRAQTFAPAGAPWQKRLAALADDKRYSQMEEARLFSQYTAVLKAVAAQRSLLLILEDLHWIDTPSGGLLFHLSREIGDSRILLVGTYRPDELPTERSDGRHPVTSMTGELRRRHGDIWLDLADQAPTEGRRFVDAYLDTLPNRLGGRFRSAVFKHTGGHPLFTVELLREMQDRGDLVQESGGQWVEGDAVDWRTVPAKVEGVIERRIDRLDSWLREVITVASVEGESFTAEVVAHVLQANDRDLVRRLSRELDRQHRLVTAQSLERLGQQNLSYYRFRHHLFQHYIYHNLDEMERVYLHEAIGNALEALYGEQVEQVAVQLVHHFDQADLTEKTVSALLLAGRRAFHLMAYDEASHYLRKGLALLNTLPDTLRRTEQELDLQLALVNVFVITQSLASPGGERALLRARALCHELGRPARLRPVLFGLLHSNVAQANLQNGRRLGEELLRLGQEQQDSKSVLLSHAGLGSCLFHLGDVISSAAHLEQALALISKQQPSSLVDLFGEADPRLSSLVYLAINHWLRGHPEQALHIIQGALAHARRQDSTWSLAYALHMSAHFYELYKDRRMADTLAEEVTALTDEHGFPDWSAHATIDRGWALIAYGQAELGIANIYMGMAELRAAGYQLAQAYFATLLAKGYAALGQNQMGLDVIAKGLAYIERSDERWCEAELHRLQGELLQMQNAPADQVEACFERAIAVARSQEAKSWELRATMGLCRLWQAQGKKAEARQMLAGIYGWFSEGFDTVDLIEAKALLGDLQ